MIPGLVEAFGAFAQNGSEGQLYVNVYGNAPPNGPFDFTNGSFQVRSQPTAVVLHSPTDVILTGPATVADKSGTLLAHLYKDATGSWLAASVKDSAGTLLWATGPTRPPTGIVAEKLALLLIRPTQN